MADRLPTTVERDSIIVEQMLTKQSTARELADRFGLSLSRIYQIVGMRAGSDVPDTISSDLHLLRLEQLFFEMQRIALAPPSYKISPTGGVVEYQGEPLIDNAEKISAAIAAMRIDESTRKLKARDLPRRKEKISEDEAMQRVRNWLEEHFGEALPSQPQTIAGEITE